MVHQVLLGWGGGWGGGRVEKRKRKDRKKKLRKEDGSDRKKATSRVVLFVFPSCTVCVSLFLLCGPLVYLSLSFVYRLCISVSPLWAVCVPQFLLHVPFVYLFFSFVGH